MRQNSRSWAVVVATLGLAFIASCGGAEPGDNKPPADLATFVQPGPPVPDKVCVSSCTTNDQCQNSCPLPTSGVSCCDTTTNACYTASATSCPAPPADMAMSGPY